MINACVDLLKRLQQLHMLSFLTLVIIVSTKELVQTIGLHGFLFPFIDNKILSPKAHHFHRTRLDFVSLW